MFTTLHNPIFFVSGVRGGGRTNKSPASKPFQKKRFVVWIAITLVTVLSLVITQTHLCILKVELSGAAACHCLQVNSDQCWWNSLGLSAHMVGTSLHHTPCMGGAPSLILPNLWSSMVGRRWRSRFLDF